MRPVVYVILGEDCERRVYMFVKVLVMVSFLRQYARLSMVVVGHGFCILVY